MSAKQVNRSLKDEMFDRIDHALGRPVDPMDGGTYRNYFAIGPDDAEKIEFDASPYWSSGTEGMGSLYYHVTDVGRRALAIHLKNISDPNRTFIVTRFGDETEIVATTHGKAKYLDYLNISDCYPDLTFGEYCKATTVRVAS